MKGAKNSGGHSALDQEIYSVRFLPQVLPFNQAEIVRVYFKIEKMNTR